MPLFHTSLNYLFFEFQAEEGEKNCNIELDTEKRVLEEFGRCLAQIIEFSGKTKKSSSAAVWQWEEFSDGMKLQVFVLLEQW